MKYLLTRFMGPTYSFEVMAASAVAHDQAMPHAYNAWLVFRNCVDIVLANDVLAFLVFALVNIAPVDSVVDVLSITVGLLLGCVVRPALTTGSCLCGPRSMHTMLLGTTRGIGVTSSLARHVLGVWLTARTAS